ncbi:hypothetical protein TRFO_24960 [Tritrichomonas foetus]|uniref:Uncharacterized protein n=1 Tax=Tritrichomonas foetus TaxID=1144522 RepID=A0A1J4K675_9EUKA|nr:hypothetical protein TRFO_24960 [Tritrichomonas foetus]|eukprot:OHT06919.1 hypothetical protein TRFO_24960 [Tritrichomonas foetus]
MKKQKTQPKTNYRTETKKIIALVNKAIMSTSLRDKNEILSEIRELWLVDNEQLESLNQSNSIKQNELTNRRKQQNDISSTLETLRQNTSFFKYFNPNSTQHKEASLIASIKEKENIISKFHQLGRPTILPEILASEVQPVQKAFTLIDLNLRRAEEIVHCYQKRLNNVEQSQESTESIIKEFGSISNLLNVLNVLEEENQQLRKKEAVYLNDSFVRRRRFGDLLPSVVRLFITVYRTLLDSCMSSLPEYQFYVPDEESHQSFDDFCSDSSFLASDPTDIDIAELGKTLETENNDHFTNPESPKEKLQSLKEIIKLTHKLNDKIEQDIEKTAKPPNKPHFDTNPTRIEKLKMENERMLDLVHTLQKKLDDILEENLEVVTKVNRTIKAKRMVSSNYVKLLQDYHDLIDSHIELLDKQNFNKSVVKTSLFVNSSFGYELMEKIEDSATKEKLVDDFKVEEEIFKASNPAPLVVIDENPPLVEDKPAEMIDPKFMMMKIMKKKKKHNNSQLHSRETSTSTTSRANIQDLDNSSKTNLTKQSANISSNMSSNLSLNPFSKGHSNSLANHGNKVSKSSAPTNFLNGNRAELIDGLSLAFELGGYTIDFDNKFYQAVHNNLNNILNGMSTKGHNLVEEYGKEMNDKLSQINYIGNRILVKEKKQISVQTIVMEKPDAETQTPQSGIVTKQPPGKKK